MERGGNLSKNSQENSIKSSAPDLLLWYHGSSSFVLLRGTVVVVVNPLDVCTYSSLQFWFFFYTYLALQKMQYLVISHQIVHASVVRIHFFLSWLQRILCDLFPDFIF